MQWLMTSWLSFLGWYNWLLYGARNHQDALPKLQDRVARCFAQQIWHVLTPSEMEQDLWSSRNPTLGQDGIFKQTEKIQWNEAFWDDWRAKGSIFCPLEVWLYTVVGKGLLTNCNFFVGVCIDYMLIVSTCFHPEFLVSNCKWWSGAK